MTLRPRATLGAITLLLATSCNKPGTPPDGQRPLATFNQASKFDVLIDRFNRADPNQIQVVAMFSPT